jgi:ABC-type nickel/cobalt efflux system permease component RcnA
MNIHSFVAWLMLAGLLVCVPVVVALIFFTVSRIGRWQRKRRRGVLQSKIYSMCLVAGIGFLQFVQTFYQPNLSNVLSAIEDEDVDEDDQGDPDSPHKHLHRQLRRIRHGQHVDRLQVRL